MAQQQQQPLIIFDWQRWDRATMLGTFTVELPSGLQIRNIELHQEPKTQFPRGAQPRRQWLRFPAAEFVDRAGDTEYRPIISFADERSKHQFERDVITEIAKFVSDEVEV